MSLHDPSPTDLPREKSLAEQLLDQMHQYRENMMNDQSSGGGDTNYHASPTEPTSQTMRTNRPATLSTQPRRNVSPNDASMTTNTRPVTRHEMGFAGVRG